MPHPARMWVSGWVSRLTQPGCLCRGKLKFVCCSILNQRCWCQVRWKGSRRGGRLQGCHQCNIHYPFSLQHRSPGVVEHPYLPAALDQDKQIVSGTSCCQLDGWWRKTSEEESRLVPQANGSVRKRSPCSQMLPCAGRDCGGRYCGQVFFCLCVYVRCSLTLLVGSVFLWLLWFFYNLLLQQLCHFLGPGAFKVQWLCYYFHSYL